MYHRVDEHSHTTKGDIIARIKMILGGRAAEAIILDDITTGASEDIKRATELAKEMVTKYGMSEKLGIVCYDDGEEMFLGRDLGVSKSYSEAVAALIDSEVRDILTEQYESAKKLLEENIEKLKALAEALMEKETINGAEFEEIVCGG